MRTFLHPFEDRRDAGRKLARALQRLAVADPLLLALPRGGVPVAYEAAALLHWDLDVLLVRKIGAPAFPELGLGAIVDSNPPAVVFNDTLLRDIKPSADYLEQETRHQLAEIARRRERYGGDAYRLGRAGRTIVLVDDGIATGGSMKAALEVLQREAVRVMFAVPVAPPDVLRELRRQAEGVCLRAPAGFRAVGCHYDDFEQTTDEEVISLLAQARREQAAFRLESAQDKPVSPSVPGS